LAGKDKRQERSGHRFRLFQIEILIIFSALIAIVTIFLDYMILQRSDRAMKETVSKLVAADSRQLELNINSYLQRMETTATLMFSDEAYYEYDATDESMEEYDKVKTEELIRSRIVDIGLMDNYADFGIVYSDDHKVGWISHGTDDLFPDGGMYDTFASYIVNERKKDGWGFGINGNTDRMFYFKRLNPDAILVSSIYTRELASVFVYPEQLDSMTVRFVDDNGIIMFSVNTDEIGSSLPGDIAAELNQAATDVTNSRTVISSDYIINSNVCPNDWQVVCSIPTRIILEENIRLRGFTVRVSICLAALFVLIGLMLIINISKPVDGMVTTLENRAEIDRLSGVMNKATFQDEVEKILAKEAKERISVFVMLDMDNFKQINDKLGHIYGDQVIIRVGKLLKRMYNEETLIGRLGGDEFALYTECVGVDFIAVKDAVSTQVEYVLEEFLIEFELEREQCNVSMSAGVYMTDDMSEDFEALYGKADKALYKSKNSGKNCFNFYREGDE
jgi:diguanylate cyclase (GGDEF)-like protein